MPSKIIFGFLFGWIFTLATPCISFADAPAAQPTQVVIISHDEKIDANYNSFYYHKVLELVLSKTIPTHGAYELKLIPVIANENRLLRAIEQHKVDVTWMPYQQDMGLQVTPVRFRLLKNLSDYRILLIRDNDQERFSTIKSLDDLRKFRGGMGSHWPDRWVMEANGLPLTLSVSYPNLFKMLAAGRFDYFSRGIYQVEPELMQYGELGLVVEQNLLLHYENPVYFYVNKQNTELAQRILQGLETAAEDGSLDALFNEFPRFALAQAQLAENRRLILRLSTQ
jgi:ABC-type amino acid transport substrate-binding protein